jgi:hypothetical protein
MQRLQVYIAVGFLLGCLAGCSPDPAPQPPTVTTEQGKANVRACLQTYNNCTLPCYAMRSNSCVHRCNASLAACYQAAE